MLILIGAILTLAFVQIGEYKENPYSDLIRFHVIANSDSDDDQRLKLLVRDALLKEIEPVLNDFETLDGAYDYLNNNLDKLEKIAQREIKNHGYEYSAEAIFGILAYPTRAYGDVILPAGNYQSLRIIIGEGKGSNWWCVLFPPLCFVDITNGIIKKESDAIPVINDGSNNEYKTEKSYSVKIKIWEVLKDVIS